MTCSCWVPLRRLCACRSVTDSGRDRWGSSHGVRIRPVGGHRDRVAGRVAGAAALGLLILASACSSSDSDAAPETPANSTTTSIVAPTSSSSTTTMVVETTTTAAPTTVSTPSVESAVRAALERGFADFSACLVAMPDCDPSVLEATRAGDLLARNIERISEWNAAGYTVVDRDQYRYVIESIEVAADGDEATAVVCLADGSKLVLPTDEGDVVIDGTFVSGRATWELRLDPDGTWRAHAAPAAGESSETDVCPASS